MHRRLRPGFGRGYGEENDFCLRAHRAGYWNVLCDDAFVLHLGGRSFAGEKAELSPRNTAILLARHPDYGAIVGEYVARDPLRPLRDAAQTWQRARDGRARHPARHPPPRRRHRAPRPRADRRVARRLAALPRHRRRRSLAGGGAPRRRRAAHLRVHARRGRGLERVRRRPCDHLRRRPSSTSTSISMCREPIVGSAAGAGPALRPHRARPRSGLSDDDDDRRRRLLVRRAGEATSAPASPAAGDGGRSRHGATGIGHSSPAALRDRPVALGGGHASAPISRRDRRHPARRARRLGARGVDRGPHCAAAAVGAGVGGAAAARRRADGRDRRCDRSGQGCAPDRGAGRAGAGAGRAPAFRRHRLSRSPGRALAKRRRAADGARSLRCQRGCRGCWTTTECDSSRIRRTGRRASASRCRRVGRRPGRRGAAHRGAARARCRHRRRLRAHRCRMARRCGVPRSADRAGAPPMRRPCWGRRALPRARSRSRRWRRWPLARSRTTGARWRRRRPARGRRSRRCACAMRSATLRGGCRAAAHARDAGAARRRHDTGGGASACAAAAAPARAAGRPVSARASPARRCTGGTRRLAARSTGSRLRDWSIC